jgi:hypothetical protein
VVDTVGELIDGMHDIRVRQALLIAALRKLGGELHLTQRDAYDSAAFDLAIDHRDDGIHVKVKAAPVQKKVGRTCTRHQGWQPTESMKGI